MSWHYLPELAAEYSVVTCSVGDASAPSNTTSTQEMSCSQDSETDVCQSFQSGMMSELSTESHGEAWLMSYQAAFHVKTFHQPEKEQELREREAGYGKKWLELSVKYDRNLHSWKTHRCLFDEDLPQSSVTLPKWGTMRSGVLYRLRTAAQVTKERGSGFWHPTPTCRDYSGATDATMKKKGDGYLRYWLHKRFSQGVSTTYPSPLFAEAVNGFPIGWTERKPLEMHKFQLWQQKHGVS